MMLLRKGLAVGIIVLFLGSVIPFIHGQPTYEVWKDSSLVHEEYYQYLTNWSVHHTNQSNEENISSMYNNGVTSYDPDLRLSLQSGPMNSPWPMQGHDVVHTCRSSYSTENNSGTEIWCVRGNTAGGIEGSAVIDNNGIIYFGTSSGDGSLYATYPNGTRKWRFRADGQLWQVTPAIAEDGTIYFSTWGGYGHFHALNPNGTVKWLFTAEASSISSPSIAEDGTIYFGDDASYIYALNPNGTRKWRYRTGSLVNACPAIDDAGMIYVGSQDGYLYALYPNGTLHWRYYTGSKIRGDASIGTDGTIYVPSFNDYFYALNTNGTLKWSGYTGDKIAAKGVAFGDDGTIYVGTELLRAYYPNGTLKWSYDFHAGMWGTVPAISADGTIFVSGGGYLTAIDLDNVTEKWRCPIVGEYDYSSPCIGANGTVYVGTTWSDYGYLHAIGNGPLRAEAGGPYQGTTLHPITLTGLAFGGLPPYQYHWDFGDGNTSAEINPTHLYTTAGNYTATFTIADSDGNISMDTTTVTVTMDYPLPVLVITRPTNAFYIADKQLFPFPFPFILGKITIQVTVESHYNIDQVIICIRDDVVYTGTTPPYEWTWTQRNFRLKNNINAFVYDIKGRYATQRIEVTKLF